MGGRVVKRAAPGLCADAVSARLFQTFFLVALARHSPAAKDCCAAKFIFNMTVTCVCVRFSYETKKLRFTSDVFIEMYFKFKLFAI